MTNGAPEGQKRTSPPQLALRNTLSPQRLFLVKQRRLCPLARNSGFHQCSHAIGLLHVKTESQPSKETVVTFEKMSPERHQNGHNFSLEGGVCTWCEMPLEHYEDRGKPRCQGVPSPRPWKPRSRTCDTPPHRRSSRFDRRIKDRCRASRHAR